MVNSVDGSNSLVYNTLCTYLPFVKRKALIALLEFLG